MSLKQFQQQHTSVNMASEGNFLKTYFFTSSAPPYSEIEISKRQQYGVLNILLNR